MVVVHDGAEQARRQCSVRRVMHPARGLAHRVGRAGRVGSVCEAGEHRRRAHVVARLDVGGLREGDPQISRHVLHRHQRHGVREGLVVGHRVALDGMRQRVHAGAGGDRGRELDGELRVDHSHPGRDVRRAADIELDLSLGVGDHSPQGDLAACPCRGRHRDHRRDPLGDGAPSPLVLEDAAVMSCHHPDPLGGVDRASAADRDQPVAALRSVFGGAGVDQLDSRVGADAVEHDRLAVCTAKDLECGVQQTRRLHTGVGDEQGAADPEQRSFGTQLADGAKALHEAGRALIGAECVFEHGLEKRAADIDAGGHGVAIQPEFRGGCV